MRHGFVREILVYSKLRATRKSLNKMNLILAVDVSGLSVVSALRMVVVRKRSPLDGKFGSNEPDPVFTFTLKYRFKPEANLCAELSVQ